MIFLRVQVAFFESTLLFQRCLICISRYQSRDALSTRANRVGRGRGGEGGGEA